MNITITCNGPECRKTIHLQDHTNLAEAVRRYGWAVVGVQRDAYCSPECSDAADSAFLVATRRSP